MASYVLIPGAGGMASYWDRVVPLLQKAGHEAIAVDLPGDSEKDGLAEYCELVLSAIGSRGDVVVVGQSLGGFTAAMVAERTKLRQLVFLNAMIPNPGETPGAWWKNTNHAEARVAAAKKGGYATEFDVQTYFLHDVPADVSKLLSPPRSEAGVVFGQPCSFTKWAQPAIKVIAGKDDRFFPLEFQERIASERLGLPVHIVPGGHLCAMSFPEELVKELIAN